MTRGHKTAYEVKNVLMYIAEDLAVFYQDPAVKKKVQAIFEQVKHGKVCNSDFKVVLAYIASILIYTNAQ